VTPENDDCYKFNFLLIRLIHFQDSCKTINPDEPACIDNTTSEGLYLGLKKVEDVLRGKEKETNVIIIVGDSGDRNGPGRIKEDRCYSLNRKIRLWDSLYTGSFWNGSFIR